jgi:hypothetical protein
MTRLPPLAIVLGVLGLLPFLGFGFLSVLPDPSLRHLMLLLAYAAVILSFLGGIHEGFALLAPAPLPAAARPAGDWKRAETLRLLGASLCALIAWGDLLLAAYGPPWLALMVMILAFAAMPAFEQRGALHGWVPRPYMWLRWVLNVAVVAVLLAVLVLRWLGVAA